ALAAGAARADVIAGCQTPGPEYPSVSTQVDNSLATPTQLYGNYCPLNSVSASLAGSSSDTFPGGSASASGAATAAIGNLLAQGSAAGAGDEGSAITVEDQFNDALNITGPSGTLAFYIAFDPAGALSTAQDVVDEGGASAQMNAYFEASDPSLDSALTGSEGVCLYD